MGKATGFIEIEREDRHFLPVEQRLRNYQEFTVNLADEVLRDQGARCMDCGIPYCHTGCPVNNLIPDWNDLVYKDDWKAASEQLHSTNNFPEFTGRICPAPCEASCTLNIDNSPVVIKTIEYSIVERAWSEGWIRPRIPRHRSGKRIAVVGSGPAGLSCAQQLVRAGHSVSIYEKQDRSGGLLRYGIPDFKLDKKTIDRRMAQMKAEGVRFHSNTHIGVDLPVSYLLENFDAAVLAGGCEVPRELPVPGRELAGIYFAMDFLRSNSRRVQGNVVPDADFISARGKHVVVIGGGDTGSDCIGTANRQRAASITQVEILSQPPETEDKALTWPNWPHKMRTSSSQEEGCTRLWDVVTKAFIDDGKGNVKAVRCRKVSWKMIDGNWKMEEIQGSDFELKADLVTLAMGFVHPVYQGMLEDFDVTRDSRGNVEASTEGEKAYHCNIDGVFSAGDMRRGQSLVVWAIHEGRQCARMVDKYLREDNSLSVD